MHWLSPEQNPFGCEEQTMIRRSCLFAPVFALLYWGVHAAQEYPIMDMVTNKVIQKYQQASCEQLWRERAERGQTRSRDEKFRFAGQRLCFAI